MRSRPWKFTGEDFAFLSFIALRLRNPLVILLRMKMLEYDLETASEEDEPQVQGPKDIRSPKNKPKTDSRDVAGYVHLFINQFVD